jgi:proteasome lid subunit RPN8/RPN11
VLKLNNSMVNEILEHAVEENPRECCGLVGGADRKPATIYRMRNVACAPLVTYETAPEDLFAAQRAMRARGEELIAIYHSHPRSKDPQPSETDVRLAYYPSTVYLIVGLGSEEPCLRAFRISERAGSWEAAEFEIVADSDR